MDHPLIDLSWKGGITMTKKNITPRKINMEPENTGPLEKENHLNQTIMTSGSSC